MEGIGELDTTTPIACVPSRGVAKEVFLDYIWGVVFGRGLQMFFLFMMRTCVVLEIKRTLEWILHAAFVIVVLYVPFLKQYIESKQF